MKNHYLLILFFCVLAISISACKKEKKTEEDESLFIETADLTNHVWYKNNDAVAPSSSATAHNPFFRVRFNSTANDVLMDNGKLPSGQSFPDGSLIVKELYDAQNGNLKLYAVMKKSNSGSAGAGWLWAEYKPDGDVVFSVSNKGDGCIGCHSSNARDYVRLFNLFP